jgi:hypothetical protein
MVILTVQNENADFAILRRLGQQERWTTKQGQGETEESAALDFHKRGGTIGLRK